MRYLFIFGFLCSFHFVHAEQIILKNPQKLDSQFGKIQTVSFGKNSYAVFSIQTRFSMEVIRKAFRAEAAFLDVPIELVGQTQSQASANMPDDWHVDLLKYDQLNPQFSGQGIIVAVLDTGVNYTHRALKNKMWVNKSEIPNNKTDDDGNGYIDDVYGYNFYDKNGNPDDMKGHGSHCAGLIAAEKKPDGRAQGVAPRAQIMALKIIGNGGVGFMSNAAFAMKYAVDHGAQILSNSWRVYSDWPNYNEPAGLQMLVDAMTYVKDHGAIFVNAAGNENIDIDNVVGVKIYPFEFFKDFPNYVSVASSSIYNQEDRSRFTNFGAKSIMLFAPGENIVSTYIMDTWASLSGTSMATPIVSGALARGLSHGYSWQEAINKLEKTSVQTPLWQQYVRYGRIDLVRYLND